MSSWNGDAIRGFLDCKAVCERTYDELAALADYHERDPRFLVIRCCGLLDRLSSC
jgi:hypothetical protein